MAICKPKPEMAFNDEEEDISDGNVTTGNHAMAKQCVKIRGND